MTSAAIIAAPNSLPASLGTSNAAAPQSSSPLQDFSQVLSVASNDSSKSGASASTSSSSTDGKKDVKREDHRTDTAKDSEAAPDLSAMLSLVVPPTLPAQQVLPTNPVTASDSSTVTAVVSNGSPLVPTFAAALPTQALEVQSANAGDLAVVGTTQPNANPVAQPVIVSNPETLPLGVVAAPIAAQPLDAPVAGPSTTSDSTGVQVSPKDQNAGSVASLGATPIDGSVTAPTTPGATKLAETLQPASMAQPIRQEATAPAVSTLTSPAVAQSAVAQSGVAQSATAQPLASAFAGPVTVSTQSNPVGSDGTASTDPLTKSGTSTADSTSPQGTATATVSDSANTQSGSAALVAAIADALKPAPVTVLAADQGNTPQLASNAPASSSPADSSAVAAVPDTTAVQSVVASIQPTNAAAMAVAGVANKGVNIGAKATQAAGPNTKDVAKTVKSAGGNVAKPKESQVGAVTASTSDDTSTSVVVKPSDQSNFGTSSQGQDSTPSQASVISHAGVVDSRLQTPSSTDASAQSAAGRNDAQVQAPTVASQGEAISTSGGTTLPAINTAKVIQSMGQTEMRVGMNSKEFGNISIQTSAIKDSISAQISLDHSGLAKALAVHLPEMQEKLGGTVPASVRIDMNGYGQGTSSGGSDSSASSNSSSGQGSGRQRQSNDAGNDFSSSARGWQPVSSSAMVATREGTLNTRLDVRV